MPVDLILLLAHDGLPPAPHDVWYAWNRQPLILLGLLLAGWAYVRGTSQLWRRAGWGRGTSPWQVAAFVSGLVVLFIALVSPLDALSSALFSAHMVQHLLLMLVAAPLLVLGAPPVAVAWAVPPAWRRDLGQWWRRQKGLSALWRLFTHPAVAWTLHAMALWLWHLPLLYQAALSSELVHAFEHSSFLGTALLFWWVVARCGQHSRVGYGLGMLFTFTTAMHSGLLGALLTFARQAWYPAYAASAPAWGLTVLEDQQLAGAIMWLPAGVVYLVATLALLGLWLQAMEKR